MHQREQAITSESAPTIRIESVRWRDIQDAAVIQRAAFRPGLAYGRVALALLKLMPGVTFIVARTGRRRVAGVAIGDVHRGNARIMNIAVALDCRRQGVGSSLLRSIEAAIPTGNVLLMAEQHNAAAQSLYEREGYVRNGFANNYYGRNHHGVWMKKKRGTTPNSALRV